MERIVRFFVERHLLVNTITLAIVVLGLLAVLRTNVEGFPEATMPMMIVTGTLPGAAAQDVETKITIPIEDELREVDGLESFTTVVTDNRSVTTVKLDDDTPDEDIFKKEPQGFLEDPVEVEAEEGDVDRLEGLGAAGVELHHRLVEPVERGADLLGVGGRRVREDADDDAGIVAIAECEDIVDDSGEVGMEGRLAVSRQRDVIEPLARLLHLQQLRLICAPHDLDHLALFDDHLLDRPLLILQCRWAHLIAVFNIVIVAIADDTTGSL